MTHTLHSRPTNRDFPGLTNVSPRGRESWYAVRVRSKFENIACATLCGKDYEAFFPVYRSRRQWSDRVKESDLPLFPGYVFCRFDVQDRLLPILTTPGVMAIVGAGKTPIPIDDEEIAAIETIVRSGLAARPCEFPGVGSRVRIEGGPLAGVEGTITSTEKAYRVVVSVSLLQRSVAVEIDQAWARPLTSHSDSRTRVVAERVQRLARAS